MAISGVGQTKTGGATSTEFVLTLRLWENMVHIVD